MGKRNEKITPEIISQRKYELIKRDPLAIELDELVRGKRKDNLSWRKVHKRFPHYHYIEVQEQGLEGILERELSRKWNIYFKSTGKLDPGKPFSWLGIYPSHPSVVDARKHINESLLPAIRDSVPYEQEHFNKHGWIFLQGQGGYVCGDDEEPTLEGLKWKGTAYIPIARGCIPILIDPRGLSNSSKTELLDQIWDIIKPTVQKRRKSNKTKKPQTIPQIGERAELGFIYSTKEMIFRNYLEWYDIHAQEKMGFRLIAFIKKQYNSNPIKANELLEKIKQLPKNPKIGNSIKGEDNIETGIKFVYHAIHEEPYKKNKVEPLVETYNCPTHKNDCPGNCSYLQDWYSKIKRLLPCN